MKITNRLEKRLFQENKELYVKLQNSKKVIDPLLQRFQKNFPEFTDHSIIHAQSVFDYTSDLLNDDEINNLNADEIYILLSACLMHDIGMCIPEAKIMDIKSSSDWQEYQTSNPDKTFTEYIRSIHQVLSFDFIKNEWKNLYIPNELYAEAIALVARAHREEKIDDFDIYDPLYAVRSGRSFVCLPYLGCIIRLADELDITNLRTPPLILKYHFPENEKSKLEFEKHRSTFLVNITGDVIRVKAKCTDQNVYLALNELYDKIEIVLKECHHIIQRIEFMGGKHYSLSIKRITREIETENFIPMNIGFSFNVKNVFDHFMSGTLYPDRFIAIREAIQNAIDCCRYKKILDKSYQPKIIIYYYKGSVVIKDNGTGMNDFIVEHYFAKLANTYYKMEKLERKYNSIAEFGIGVFSYFLLCDYFDVKTKMKNKEALWFRATKNPDAKFYFFDDISDIKEGTELILYIKDSFKKSFDFSKLLTIIRHFIRDVEIPIIVEEGKRKEKVTQVAYEFKPEFKTRLNFFHQDRIKQLTLLSTKIDNENYRGISGTIVPIDENQIILPKNIEKWFREKDRYRIRENRKINILNKGIFVEEISASYLKNIFATINILSEDSLTLNRSQFLDRKEVWKIVEIFEFGLIKQIFESWSKLSNENKFKRSQRFIDTTFDYSPIFREQQSDIIFDFLEKELYCSFFHNNKFQFSSVRELFTKHKKILFYYTYGEFKTGDPDQNDLESLFLLFKVPILFFIDDLHSPFVNRLFNRNNFEEKIVIREDTSYLFVFPHKSKKRETIFEYRPVVDFSEDLLCTLIQDTLYFNNNHPLTKFLLNNKEKIDSNQETFELCNEIHEMIRRFKYGDSVDLTRLNNILSEINTRFNTSFKLQKDDFPPLFKIR